MNCVNTAGNLVADSECEGVKPPTSESCDMGLCAKGWYHTSWSEEVRQGRKTTGFQGFCLAMKQEGLLSYRRSHHT